MKSPRSCLGEQASPRGRKPVLIDGKVTFNAAKLRVRQKAMVVKLPKQGIAVVLLGGSHDLGRLLPPGASYVAVTPKAYPGK